MALLLLPEVAMVSSVSDNSSISPNNSISVMLKINACREKTISIKDDIQFPLMFAINRLIVKTYLFIEKRNTNQI